MNSLPSVFTPEQVTKKDMQTMREDLKHDRVGFVYFVSVECKPVIKIGFAKDMEARMQGLQTGNHMKLDQHFIIKTCKHAEKIFQRIFASDRIRLEWFNHTDELDDFILCLQDVQLANMTAENMHEHFFFTPEHIAAVVHEWETNYSERAR